MKQCENQPNVFAMTIIDHHREYQLPRHPHVYVQTCWKGYDARSHIDCFIELFYPNHPVPEISHRRTPHVTDEQLVAVLKRSWFTHPNILPDPCEPLDLLCDVDATFYRITGHIDNLCEWAKMYADQIKLQSHEVKGDDDYYDYFPTNHYMFYCVCRELNLRDLYVEAVMYIMSNLKSRYVDDDEDTIQNFWTD